MSRLAIILMFSTFCIVFSRAEPEGAKKASGNRNVFVELPGMHVAGDHWILTHAKITLLEESQSFELIPDPKNPKADIRKKQNFGIVFLAKKNERGLPSDAAKREKLFKTLDSKSSSDGITHWYIFQMRSSTEDLIGVYGPPVQIK